MVLPAVRAGSRWKPSKMYFVEFTDCSHGIKTGHCGFFHIFALGLDVWWMSHQNTYCMHRSTCLLLTWLHPLAPCGRNAGRCPTHKFCSESCPGPLETHTAKTHCWQSPESSAQQAGQVTRGEGAWLGWRATVASPCDEPKEGRCPSPVTDNYFSPNSHCALLNRLQRGR